MLQREKTHGRDGLAKGITEDLQGVGEFDRGKEGGPGAQARSRRDQVLRLGSAVVEELSAEVKCALRSKETILTTVTGPANGHMKTVKLRKEDLRALLAGPSPPEREARTGAIFETAR